MVQYKSCFDGLILKNLEEKGYVLAFVQRNRVGMDLKKPEFIFS